MTPSPTPTDSAEKVVAEPIGPNELAALKRHVDHGLVSSGTRQTLASLIALIESQRATIERQAAENSNLSGLVRFWIADSREAHDARQAAEARVSALEAALADVLATNQRFRDQMPADWEGDPMQDACDRARQALSPSTEKNDGA
jgi:hypothetical protein